MSAAVYGGPRKWELDEDDEGYRTYTVVHLVHCDAVDGPGTVSVAAGLPLPGDVWNFMGDYDPWCWCLPGKKVKKHQEREGERSEWWTVEQKFSNRPPEDSRCHDQAVEDPLMEPQKVSGSFSKRKEEATTDLFGLPIRTSSHELIRGPQNEWDVSDPTVSVEQNVPDLELGLLADMIDTTNRYPLWGLGAGMIRLVGVSWDKKYYGACFAYYTRKFEFEIRYKGWNRTVLDEGTKVMRGHWSKDGADWVLDPVWYDGTFSVMPDPGNPNHFDRYKDRNGENSRVLLNGKGQPFNPSHDVLRDTIYGCEDGAPSIWIVHGQDGTETTLTWDAGTSKWTDGSGIELAYDAGSSEFHLTVPGFDSYWWRHLNAWSCFSENLMTYYGTDLTVPAYQLQVSPGETKPGSTTIEYYGDSDFLLLSIPETF
jgi:hypothetical protein